MEGNTGDNLTTLEREFEAQLENFTDEVRIAERCFQIYTTTYEMYGAEADVKKLVDKNIYFWLTTLGALQMTMSITIARIFDSKAPYSINRLMQLAHEPTLFTVEALSHRKKRLSENADEWLPDYTRDLRSPSKEDLKVFGTAIKKHRKEFDATHLIIRQKWFAHREFTREEASAAMSKVSIDGIREMLACLNDVGNALFQLYNNGTVPTSSYFERPSVEDAFVIDQTKDLLLQAARIFVPNKLS